MRVRIARPMIAGAALVVSAAVVLVASPARAAEVDLITVSGSEITVTAGDLSNFILIQTSPTVTDGWTFSEFGAGIELAGPASACFFPDPTSHRQITCVVPLVNKIRVVTGGGSDTVNNYTSAPIEFDLGAGDDSAFIGGRPGITSTVFAGAGNDWIGSGIGNDRIAGGAGFDTVSVDAFTYPGVDPTLPYVGVAYPVTASLVTRLSTRSVDTDAIVEMESIRTGAGADVLTGDNLANVLHGGAGNDIITGGGGNDTGFGGAGRDRITGGEGDDRIYGEDGDDHLYGDAGTDILSGDNGFDRCFGGEAFAACEIAAT